MLKRRDSGSAEPEKPENAEKKKPSYSVSIYIVILFVVVLVLIMLSYFVQQSRSSKTISDMTEQHDRFSSQALQNIEELQNQNLALIEEIEQRDDRIDELEAELEKTKINWGKSVKAVEDAMQVDYNRLLQRYQAVEYLLTAETAATAGDRDAVEEALLSLEPLAGNLDPQFREEYQRLADKFLPEE